MFVESLESLKKESLIGSETKKVVLDRIYINKFRAEEDDPEVEEVAFDSFVLSPYLLISTLSHFFIGGTSQKLFVRKRAYSLQRD